MKHVLAIDGGGIRGVIPGVLLAHIEDKVGKPISEIFDLIVGTSTGGILAAGLAVPNARGKPKFSAEDMLQLYTEEGHEIFSRSFWKGVTSVGGTLDEKYDEKPLEKLLRQRMGEATLKDTLTSVVITSYDIEKRAPYFFKSRRAKRSKDRNHYLRDAARATSAAPTYFEPEVVRSLAARSTRRVLIDGGVFVNNPAMCAYSEAIDMGLNPADMTIVSLGTGTATREIPFEDAKDWGLAGWVRPIISVMMDGQADSADHHLKELLPWKDEGGKQRYFRFDVELESALDDMDAAHAANIAALKSEAERIMDTQQIEMEHLTKLLRS
ncbi:MAG: CBASS cGAMP-activated phospholipase [Halioglobus sp.]